MIHSARIAIAAPLALALAACGETTDVDERVVETPELETPTDVTLPEVEVEYPEVPVNARTSVDYAGTYELRTSDDQVSTIVLEEGDTYVWRAPDGTETRGSFTWGEDNSRILIERDGETQAYAVAENVLYRLPAADAPTAGERSEETTWRRSTPAAAEAGSADTSGE
ncbi:hypothetical protein [Pelagerythrobacter marensis]|uniref:Uncharacterized protein n=1 Tax=Pelagerythrobacter marensis TaxID=543877 RepID=A0A0G3XD95_9SPHN|nr:hypothetical protein [Pelagerythrobacter marensis]AKM08549.1 hypothetical protein AM2010_2494 [Pelagerythrobacter marensis]